MITKNTTWRKATEEELENGSPEMVIVSVEEIEIPDIVEDKVDLSKIDLTTLTREQLTQLKEALNSI